MTNVKTPKNAKDLENLDGKAGMTKEELSELIRKAHESGGSGKVIPIRPPSEPSNQNILK